MSQRTLIIGAVAYDPKVVTIWEGIKYYFLQEGCPMDFVLFSNYEAQVNALLNKSIDIAWNTNLAYVATENKLKGAARVLVMRDTDFDFTSRIVCLSSAPFNSLSDLKSKRIAFGSRDSAQAAVIPQYFLQQEGLYADRDYQCIRFNTDVGKHGDTGTSETQVIEAVLSGQADGGAIGENTWQGLQKSADRAKLKSIWTSPGYSHCNFTALPEIDEQLAAAFIQTLLKMDYENAEHRKILDMEGLTKWMPGDKAGYKHLFAAAEQTGYQRV